MTHDWMIDVLADLRQYAIRHYYLRLAEQLDDAIVAAAVELRADRAAEVGGAVLASRRRLHRRLVGTGVRCTGGMQF